MATYQSVSLLQTVDKLRIFVGGSILTDPFDNSTDHTT
jgi:hypothetical protein